VRRAALARSQAGLRLSDAQIGGLTSATAIAYAPTLLLAGWLVDRVGVRVAVIVAALAYRDPRPVAGAPLPATGGGAVHEVEQGLPLVTGAAVLLAFVRKLHSA